MSAPDATADIGTLHAAATDRDGACSEAAARGDTDKAQRSPVRRRQGEEEQSVDSAIAENIDLTTHVFSAQDVTRAFQEMSFGTDRGLTAQHLQQFYGAIGEELTREEAGWLITQLTRDTERSAATLDDFLRLQHPLPYCEPPADLVRVNDSRSSRTLSSGLASTSDPRYHQQQAGVDGLAGAWDAESDAPHQTNPSHQHQ
eukprot:TRINITY_DN16665_c0_g1_i1.p1 TRINITY_DN16665_c0_g1~~TRINITY_DN16665_c0_g1_i1.p1  ORF type:complete len:222 (+),score=53.48 TRINITY_DN16665_c0_g1_i1:64-666(+)